MTGYEKSPDYGQPGPIDWVKVIVSALLIGGLVAIAILRWNG